MIIFSIESSSWTKNRRLCMPESDRVASTDHVACHHFVGMVATHLKDYRVSLPKVLAGRRGPNPSVVERVVERKRPDLCREHELRKLCSILFQRGTMKMNRAQGYIKRIFPRTNGVAKPAYKNSRRQARQRNRVRMFC